MQGVIDGKPIPEKTTYLKYGFVLMETVQQHCPKCGGVLNAGPNYQPNYCDKCGQKLDFRGTEWVPEKKLGYVGEEAG